MPKITDDALLRAAIEAALLDREAFEDAVQGDADATAATRADILAIKGLRGKLLASLSQDELHAAMLAFLYGEQWELSYADSSPGARYEKKARAMAARYREARHRRWGKTKLEHMLAGATPVSIFNLRNS